MVTNEEGKLEDLPRNKVATELFLRERPPVDYISGDVLVCKDGEIG